jgi:hypothetical protein
MLSYPVKYFRAYRNDRSSLGRGVFILVYEDILSVEEPEYVTNCELEWVKIKIQGNKNLHIGAFYMSHRNVHDIKELDHSLNPVTESKAHQVVVVGDFNCSGVDWPSLSVSFTSDKLVHQILIDLSIAHNITQMQEESTSQDNTLDLYFTTNSSLVKNCATVPGLSDHAIVVVDSDTKPQYCTTPRRKHFLFVKADWPSLKTKCLELSATIKTMYENGLSMQDMWETFKSMLTKDIESTIPSKTFKGKMSPPWLNSRLKKMQRRRLYHQAKRTSNWSNYRHYQKEGKRAHRRAKWSYIHETIKTM